MSQYITDEVITKIVLTRDAINPHADGRRHRILSGKVIPAGTIFLHKKWVEHPTWDESGKGVALEELRLHPDSYRTSCDKYDRIKNYSNEEFFKELMAASKPVGQTTYDWVLQNIPADTAPTVLAKILDITLKHDYCLPILMNIDEELDKLIADKLKNHP